jgi:hypothetical protein
VWIVSDVLDRACRTFLGGPSGALRFRFVMQPLVAATLAWRAGRRDARAGRPPFLWDLASGKGHRRELVARGWRDIERVFFVAMAVDLVYQFLEHVRPSLLGAVMTASVLAVLPYVLLAGPANRLARRLSSKGPSSMASTR